MKKRLLMFFLAPTLLHAQPGLQQFLNTPQALNTFQAPQAGMPPAEPNVPTTTSRFPTVPERAQEILNYWFGDLPSGDFFPIEKMDTWFAATPDISIQMKENFGQDVQSAARGELNSWRETPRGRLALILLLDQFPRHMYRNKPQAFLTDPMAQGLVLEGLQRGDDKLLYPVERAFFYLPLEHSENLQMQDLSVRLYQQLLNDSALVLKPEMDDFLHFAILHRNQIARFGRFPHRNIVLGRPSTPEETIFLQLWKTGF